jgi:hypothetical protein
MKEKYTERIIRIYMMTTQQVHNLNFKK